MSSPTISARRLVAAALTLIERSLLPDRPVFFYHRRAARRRQDHGGQHAGRGRHRKSGIVAAWSSNEEERRKALLAYFILGEPYILWDNIPRGLQIVMPSLRALLHRGVLRGSQARRLEMISTAASTIHFFTGNNIGPKGDLASRSLSVRLDVDRVDPENRAFKHPDPFTWTQNNRAEIMDGAVHDLAGQSATQGPVRRGEQDPFQMWWRLIGSAVEHAAAARVDFQKLFLSQEGDEEEAASVADMLEIFEKSWPNEQEFAASEVAAMVNRAAMASSMFYRENPNEDEQLVREVLLPGRRNTTCFRLNPSAGC